MIGPSAKYEMILRTYLLFVAYNLKVFGVLFFIFS